MMGEVPVPDGVDAKPPEISPPRRVVSLVPSVTESLFDLDLGDRLAGRTQFCVYPESEVQRVPMIGGTKTPDLEQINQLQPDLVIANWEENRREDVAILRDAGIPVWVTLPRSASDVFTFLWDVMHLFDHPVMVPRIRLIEQTYDYVFAASESMAQRVKTFVPIWNDPLMTMNHDTYMHDLLRVCGAENVFAEQPERYPTVSDEEVIAAAPELILLPDEPFKFQEKHRQRFAALDVPAAKNDRIYFVDGSLLSWHGTRIAHALQQLPAMIQGAS